MDTKCSPFRITLEQLEILIDVWTKFDFLQLMTWIYFKAPTSKWAKINNLSFFEKIPKLAKFNCLYRFRFGIAFCCKCLLYPKISCYSADPFSGELFVFFHLSFFFALSNFLLVLNCLPICTKTNWFFVFQWMKKKNMMENVRTVHRQLVHVHNEYAYDASKAKRFAVGILILSHFGTFSSFFFSFLFW